MENYFPVTSAAGAFLLAFPALFSIVNPPGSALVFNQVTEGRSAEERARLAWRIALYSAIVLLGSLWFGGYVLNFFGVSLGALRVAGGLVVAIRAWGLLADPQGQEERKVGHAEPARQTADDVAFFPLTMPFTTGPGSISVAIALSSQRSANGEGLVGFFVGLSAAALANALLVGIAYRSSGRIVSILGVSGARVVSRLVAFLLLCVGVQIMSTGVESLLGRAIGATLR